MGNRNEGREVESRFGGGVDRDGGDEEDLARLEFGERQDGPIELCERG